MLYTIALLTAILNRNHLQDSTVFYLHEQRFSIRRSVYYRTDPDQAELSFLPLLRSACFYDYNLSCCPAAPGLQSPREPLLHFKPCRQRISKPTF